MGSNKRNLTKNFDINEEQSIYSSWEDNGCFLPINEGKEPFCIPMPPPNITGQLHMGHALFTTLQDILIRHRRMTGRDSIWIPGTDHAGIATQEKIMEHLYQNGNINPTREEFLDCAWEWKNTFHKRITTQLRYLGTSCDWSRERFTLDNEYSKSVNYALKRCADEGMLYRENGQWYLRMDKRANELLARYENGELTIYPESEGKTFCHFLKNIEPWCISRQIWWGHRIPIWYNANGEWIAGTKEEAQAKFGNDIRQDEDTLDTWFSSSLWPFAILGWPNETPDFNRWYPSSLIETADDILFFWCARMLMMGLLLTDKMAFNTIYLHGIIRDKHGRKMSKSLGNGIDPLDIISKYGTDALRLGLCENTSAGLDIKLSDDKFESAKRFANKIWQGSKFIINHWDRMGRPTITIPEIITNNDDKIIMNEFIETKEMMHKCFNEYDFREASSLFRRFFHNRFCDWWIETRKKELYENNIETGIIGIWIIGGCLKMIHPIMPFITEKIWGCIYDTALITTQW